MTHGEPPANQSTYTVADVPLREQELTPQAATADVDSADQKRKQETSMESRKSWSSSKPPPLCSTSCGLEQEQPTKKRRKPLTYTLPRSTPSLLTRMNHSWGKVPTLWKHLTDLRDELRKSGKMLSTSWNKYQRVGQMKKKMNLELLDEGPEKMKCLGTTTLLQQFRGVAALRPCRILLWFSKDLPGIKSLCFCTSN